MTENRLTKEQLLSELKKLKKEYELMKNQYQHDIEICVENDKILKERESQTKSLFDNAADAIFIADLETGIILDANKAAAKLMLMPVNNIKGLHQSSLYPQELANQSKEFFAKHIKEVKQFDISNPIELEVLCSDGSKIPVEILASKVIYNGKECIMGTFRDITMRKEAEESLNQERILLRTIIDAIPDSIYVKDINCKKKIANKTNYQTHLGLNSEEEVLGKTDFDLFPNETAKKFYEDDMRVINNGESIINREEELTMPNGKKIWQLTSKIPFYNYNNKVIGLVGIGRNITDRKNALEALKESEDLLKRQNKLFSSLLENLTVGIFMVEAPSGKPLIANEMAKKLLGRGILPDATKANISEVYKAKKYGTSEIYPIEEMPIIKGIYGEAAHIDDMIVERPDGTEVLLEVYGTPIKEDNGKIWASLVSFYDITERKKAEAEIQQKNEELEEINATKDKFFSIIAHDLRSPFNAFLGLTEMLSENISEFSIAELQVFIKKINESASNLFSLLENLLQWSRVQRGSIEFNPTKTFISELVNDTVITLKEIAQQKEIIIINNVKDGKQIFIDIQMMNTILRNLISNAIKFTPRGGTIEIGSSDNDFAEQAGISIFIKDNGIGMKKEIINNLFMPDKTVSRPGTEKEPSTGLGLVLCKEFIEKHNGKIRVESEEGKGSTFYIDLQITV